VQEQYGVTAGAAGRSGDGLAAGPPLPMAEALAVIVANERGRQGRASFDALRAARAARLRDQRRAASGAARALVLSSVPWPPARGADSAGRDASRLGVVWSLASACLRHTQADIAHWKDREYRTNDKPMSRA
jgi:hypothetical protein